MTGSREELYKLATILLDNALKYSDGAGPIRITLSRQRKITLTVYNTCEHGRGEGDELTVQQLVPGLVNVYEFVVGVALGVAVAGEVLGAAHYSRFVQAIYLGGHHELYRPALQPHR